MEVPIQAEEYEGIVERVVYEPHGQKEVIGKGEGSQQERGHGCSSLVSREYRERYDVPDETEDADDASCDCVDRKRDQQLAVPLHLAS